MCVGLAQLKVLLMAWHWWRSFWVWFYWSLRALTALWFSENEIVLKISSSSSRHRDAVCLKLTEPFSVFSVYFRDLLRTMEIESVRLIAKVSPQLLPVRKNQSRFICMNTRKGKVVAFKNHWPLVIIYFARCPSVAMSHEIFTQHHRQLSR